MSTRQSGVTLMELMIVVAIVGILASIAYPSYREQVRRSNRTEARVALEQRALALEKCFTRYMSYNNANCAAAQAGSDGPTENGHYNVVAAATATTFDLTATPQGGQATDAQCMNFTIDEAGRRDVSVAGARDVCW